MKLVYYSTFSGYMPRPLVFWAKIVKIIHKQVCTPRSLQNKQAIVHMISQTFNFWRDVFWSFSSFYSIVFVRSLWLWLSRGGTQSCGRPPLQRMVALCMCIIYVITTYSSFSSPSFYVIFFLHHSIGILYLELFPSTYCITARAAEAL